jgi:type II secretory pathway pseudopilin PulG
MTLLEAIVAFVLLSVVGVVCLDQSRGASQLQVRSAEWTRAVTLAESAMAEATSAPLAVAPPMAATPSGPRVQVERRRWQPGVDVVHVSVPLPDGRRYVLERLARAAAPGAPAPTASAPRSTASGVR